MFFLMQITILKLKGLLLYLIYFSDEFYQLFNITINNVFYFIKNIKVN